MLSEVLKAPCSLLCASLCFLAAISAQAEGETNAWLKQLSKTTTRYSSFSQHEFTVVWELSAHRDTSNGPNEFVAVRFSYLHPLREWGIRFEQYDWKGGQLIERMGTRPWMEDAGRMAKVPLAFIIGESIRHFREEHPAQETNKLAHISGYLDLSKEIWQDYRARVGQTLETGPAEELTNPAEAARWINQICTASISEVLASHGFESALTPHGLTLGSVSFAEPLGNLRFVPRASGDWKTMSNLPDLGIYDAPFISVKLESIR